MNTTKADAIQFLKSSIARYRHELATLQPPPSKDAPTNIVNFASVAEQREELNALIEDARRLLSELRPNAHLRAG